MQSSAQDMNLAPNGNRKCLNILEKLLKDNDNIRSKIRNNADPNGQLCRGRVN